MAAGLPCGGWCPEGRAAEDGRVPEQFPVTELPGADFAQRTRQNVIDSDGTVIFFQPPLCGGSLLTRQEAAALNKPLLLIDADQMSPPDAARALVRFVRGRAIATLNVAGPRASEWPDADAYVSSAVRLALVSLL